MLSITFWLRKSAGISLPFLKWFQNQKCSLPPVNSLGFWCRPYLIFQVVCSRRTRWSDDLWTRLINDPYPKLQLAFWVKMENRFYHASEVFCWQCSSDLLIWEKMALTSKSLETTSLNTLLCRQTMATKISLFEEVAESAMAGVPNLWYLYH